MLNPKIEFEKEIKKFKEKLNFSYEWKIRTENKFNLEEQLKKYKNELGNYIDLYKKLAESDDYYEKIYPIYKKISDKLHYLTSTVDKRIKISLEHKFKQADDGINYIYPKGNYLYKGVKYFYTPEQEIKQQNEIGFYGDKYLAYYYAKRYNGVLQVYKLKKDLKLFNVTSDKNIYFILDMIKTNFLDKDKADTIFFDNVSYKEFYKSVKTKYGIGINKYFQAYNISKYSKFNDMWLYEPEGDLTKYRNALDKTYTGWYYGAGYIDRVCAYGIMLLIKDNFNGITCTTGFYSPYTSTTSTEVILWNIDKSTERRPNHKYDSMQFIKKLDFNPLEIKFNSDFYRSNANFRLIKFYLTNQMELNKIDKFNFQSIKTIKDQIKLLSLSVNNFLSINLNDTPEIILSNFNKLIISNDIDICCIQNCHKNYELLEKYIDKNYTIKKYVLIGIVLIYKSKLDILNISSLDIGKYSYSYSGAVFFELNKKKYCIVKLDTGKSFKDRSGSLYEPEELLKIIAFNTNNRINQLNKIIANDPFNIIGDFSFTPFDKEYNHLIKTNYKSKQVQFTTIDNEQKDFVFSKEEYKYFDTLKFPYSDHLPIICVL